jgi:hypothetical protein
MRGKACWLPGPPPNFRPTPLGYCPWDYNPLGYGPLEAYDPQISGDPGDRPFPYGF